MFLGTREIESKAVVPHMAVRWTTDKSPKVQIISDQCPLLQCLTRSLCFAMPNKFPNFSLFPYDCDLIYSLFKLYLAYAYMVSCKLCKSGFIFSYWINKRLIQYEKCELQDSWYIGTYVLLDKISYVSVVEAINIYKYILYFISIMCNQIIK